MKRENIVKISAVIITFILVAILLSQISIGDVAKTLTSINPIYLVIGFVLYIFTYFFRALRFHILLNNKANIKDLFTIVCVHNMANNILPARTGEVSYVYLSKKLHNIPVGEGIASLMVARVFDLITISLLFFVATMCVKDLPEMISNVILILAGFLVLVVLILIGLTYFGEQFMKVIKNIISRLGWNRFQVAEYLLRKGDETAESLGIIKSNKIIIGTSVTSVAIWILLYSANYFWITAIGINLNIWVVIFGVTFSFFTVILPIQGIGGFGTIEGGWTIGFVAMGISKEMAIISGFIVHIIGFVCLLIMGVYGIIAYTIKMKEVIVLGDQMRNQRRQ